LLFSVEWCWVAAEVERFVSRRLCQNYCGLVADAAAFLLLAALLLHLVRHSGAEECVVRFLLSAMLGEVQGSRVCVLLVAVVARIGRTAHAVEKEDPAVY